MSKKVKHEYSDDELIRRVTDIEEVKKLANKRVYYMINGGAKELDELWVSKASTPRLPPLARTPATMWVWTTSAPTMATKHAADLGDGVGTMNAHPISTGLVKLVGDSLRLPRACGTPSVRTPRPTVTAPRAGHVEHRQGRHRLCQEGRRLEDLASWRPTTPPVVSDTYGDHPVYIDYATDPVAVGSAPPPSP